MKIDDFLAEKLIDNIKIFEKIHPNYITISGILSNLLIYYFLKTKKVHLLIIIILIIYRYFTDILDGAVARKYKKTSKLGGYLDTINDLMFILLMCYLYLGKKITYIIFICCLIMIQSYNLFYDHSKIKENTIFAFYINNSIIIYILLIIFIIYKHDSTSA